MRLALLGLALVLLAGCGSDEQPATSAPPAAADTGLDPGCEPSAFNEFQAGEPQSGNAEEVAGAAFARSPLGPGGEVERVGIDRDETLHVRYVRDGKVIGIANLIGGEGAWTISEMTICAEPPSSSP